MTEFSAAVTDYLQTRRAMGYKLAEDGRLLRQFAGYLDTIGAEHLSVVHALSWATEPRGRRARLARPFGSAPSAASPDISAPWIRRPRSPR